ncbi:hypothetical protein HPB52_016745 [Rhipicephalus sanguineus]|uniref:Uncharacterized protein n=1 Tax=Rhipicephalus sanguineus TaxID=34632 RepID=A0A9D4QDK2_RHISA|nr:hypothetical protein HPB52_016745 [Rhipicephalus sanguineus]
MGDGTEDSPHEDSPMCIVCGGPHLTSCRECTGKFIRLQQPGRRTSGSPAQPRCQPTGKAPPPSKATAATLSPGVAESPALSTPCGNAARDQHNRPAAMLPKLCPPVPPFHPIYPRAWFMRLDAILAVNGIKAQPMMHAVLLNALPVELCHLAAKSSSSPRPYDDLCAAGAGPIGPEPSLDQDFTSPATIPPTSRPATSASIPAPDHPPDEVQEVPAAIGHSTERSVFSTASAHGPSDSICTSSPTSTVHDTSDTSGSTTATSPHALEPGIDTDIVTPAVRPPIAEASPVMSNKPAFSTSTLCASCQQELPSSSKSPAADVQAHNQLRPNVRDAATMTENPEDHPPCLPQVDQTAYALPATQAYNPPAAPHSRSPSPTKLHSATTAAPSTSLSSTAHHTEISRATSICSARLAARLHSTRQTMEQPHPVMYHRQRRYRHRRRINCVARPSRLRSCPRTSKPAGPDVLHLRSTLFLTYLRPSVRKNRQHHNRLCVCRFRWAAPRNFSAHYRFPRYRCRSLLPTASLRRDPRPLRFSQSRPPETQWFPTVLHR